MAAHERGDRDDGDLPQPNELDDIERIELFDRVQHGCDPGLDLAPRTDLTDAVDPQSYQPLAVADALLALSLASDVDLRVHSLDVNPRVVRALEAAARGPLALHLFAGILETADQPFRPEYRAYMHALGRAIGEETTAPRLVASDRHYLHSIAVRPAVARALSVERLNIVTERLVNEPPFDVAVATNVLTYFDDRQLALARAPFDLRLVVEEVKEITEAMAVGRELAVRAAPLDPAWALGDADRTRHILLNLASNAVRYTPSGEIAFSLQRNGAVVGASVRDTGPGIAPEHVERIFDRFFRIDQSRSRALGGTGLGLAIARLLAELQGGEITVESAPRAGSTFTVWLPAAGLTP